jgi:hypothetical protein
MFIESLLKFIVITQRPRKLVTLSESRAFCWMSRSAKDVIFRLSMTNNAEQLQYILETVYGCVAS